MPKFTTTIEVSAVQTERDIDIVWDGGKFTVEAGQWLVISDTGMPDVVSDAELAERFERIGDKGPRDERAQHALATGHL